MHIRETQAAQRSQDEAPEGIQRLELLAWRFTAAEIQSLSLLQLVHIQRPNALDQPLEEGRLKFARWLVEQGRLSEDVGSGPEVQPPAADASILVPGQGNALTPSREISSGDQAGEPKEKNAEENAQEESSEQRHFMLLGAWSRVRCGMAKVADCGRKLGRLVFLPEDGDPGRPYGSYDPYDSRGLYGGVRWVTEDPWYWMRLRHDS